MKNEKEVNQLLEAIIADYVITCSYNTAERIEEFRSELSAKEGKKYLKVLSDRSVWGFVVLKDDAKFKAGDILKAASYNAPARNKARGNILDGGYSIQWTGPRYL